MDLISKSALRVARVVWRPGHGGFAFTVVCKATFELRPDVSPLAAVQEPVLEADVHASEGGALALASELVPLKKRPEVLVTGHAFAPDGRPVRSLVARLRVGEIDKSIEVVGDRSFDAEGWLGAPIPFGRMPLVWERAAGGPGTSNPAGILFGEGARTDILGRVPAPNLLPAGFALASRGDVVPPVGFGPIAPAWPARAACLQHHAPFWDPGRWHERPLPADIDLMYFNAAPPDQQRAQPFGEEAIHLDHLHPRFPHLSTRLAPVLPAATVDHGAGPQPLQLRCDTMGIDTDRGLAMLVWRAHVVIDQPDRPGRVVVTGPAEPEEALPARASGTTDVRATLGVDAFKRASAALPFSPAAPAAISASTKAAAPASAPLMAERAAQPDAGDTVPPTPEQALEATIVPGFMVPAAPLPFGPSQGESAPRRDARFAGSGSRLPDQPGRAAATGPAKPGETLPAPASGTMDLRATLGVDAFKRAPAALPFSPAAAPSATSASAKAAAPAPAPLMAERAAQLDLGDTVAPTLDPAVDATLVPGFMVPVSAALPFAPPPSQTEPRREPLAAEIAPGLLLPPTVQPPPFSDDADGPPTARRAESRDAPMSPGPSAPWAASWASPPAEAQQRGEPVSPWAASPDPARVLTPPAVLRGEPIPPPSYTPLSSVSAEPSSLREVPASPSSGAPVPPPLLGAIATAPQGASEAPRNEPRAAAEAGAPTEAAVATPEPEPEVDFDAYPPERCGAIAARLACNETQAGDVLRAEDLDADRWNRVHDHWLERIRDEAGRGRKKALSEYDAAYVGVLEVKRGPIELKEYARLAEAAERGAVAGALAERGLPEGTWPHVHRVWIGRMVKDVRLGKQVRAGIDAVRAAG